MVVKSSVVEGRIPSAIASLSSQARWQTLTRLALASSNDGTLNSVNVTGVTVSGTTVSTQPIDWCRQRQLFQSVIAKSAELAVLPELQKPGWELLAELAVAAHAAALKADRLLISGVSTSSRAAALTAGERLRIEAQIERAIDLQDRLQRQLALARRFLADARILQGELESLAGPSEQAPEQLEFHGIRGLTRDIAADRCRDITQAGLHPQLAVDLLHAESGNRVMARILTIGLATARTVARVARMIWLQEDAVELLTAAALLQDCGKVLLQSPGRNELAMFRRPDERHLHAVVGAAVVARYRHAPPALAYLIRLHHRRGPWGMMGASVVHSAGLPNPVSQGLVFPSSSLQNAAARSSTVQSAALQQARVLATASRFERLRLKFARRTSLLTAPAHVERPAMQTVWRETLAGVWDSSTVQKILISREGFPEFCDQSP